MLWTQPSSSFSRYQNMYWYISQQQDSKDRKSSGCSFVTSGGPRIQYLDQHYSLFSSMTLLTISIPPQDCLQMTDSHRKWPSTIDTLVNWSSTWRTEFNVSKCAIMQAENKRSKTDFTYKMKGESLERLTISHTL